MSVLIYLFIHFVEFNFKLTTLHGWYRDTTWYRDTSAGIVSYDILWYRDNPTRKYTFHKHPTVHLISPMLTTKSCSSSEEQGTCLSVRQASVSHLLNTCSGPYRVMVSWCPQKGIPPVICRATCSSVLSSFSLTRSLFQSFRPSGSDVSSSMLPVPSTKSS